VAKPKVEVEGLRELRKALRDLGDVGLKKGLTLANKGLAADVAKEAQALVPVRSGRLKASIRPLASQTSARVAAGSMRVPYAKAIEYGRKRGGLIKPSRFLNRAAAKVAPKAIDAYQREIDALIRKAGLD
jgi:hypothetical protein